MSEDDIPPLPCTYGDMKVPSAVWAQTASTYEGCWRWSGPVSPSGNPVWRRKSVWRYLFDRLCGGSVEDLPRRVPPQCGSQLCVNPDHRVPPEDRIPRLTCPTCGQPTAVQYVEGNATVPSPEKHPPVHPSIRNRQEPPRRRMTREEIRGSLNIQTRPLPAGSPTGRWLKGEDGAKRVEFQHGIVLSWDQLTDEQKAEFNRKDGKQRVESGTFEREITETMEEAD